MAISPLEFIIKTRVISRNLKLGRYIHMSGGCKFILQRIEKTEKNTLTLRVASINWGGLYPHAFRGGLFGVQISLIKTGPSASSPIGRNLYFQYQN